MGFNPFYRKKIKRDKARMFLLFEMETYLGHFAYSYKMHQHANNIKKNVKKLRLAKKTSENESEKDQQKKWGQKHMQPSFKDETHA